MSSQLDSKVLPLLALGSGVVLPGMTVTLTLETSEAQDAFEAARHHSDSTLLLIPKVGTGYARVGAVAKIDETLRRVPLFRQKIKL